MSVRTSLSTLFQRNPIGSWYDIDPMFGDTFFDLDGNEIKRYQTIAGSNRRLPAVLDIAQTTVGDLIPATSWGASLANLLTQRKNPSRCQERRALFCAIMLHD